MTSSGTGFPTDQTTVLTAIVSLLQQNVPALNGENLCFVSLDPNAAPTERQNLYATVTPMNGSFEEPIFTGSSEALEQTAVLVTVISQMQLDRPDESIEMMTDEARGLLSLKQQVLSALNGAMPTDQDGNNILQAPMRPINSTHPPCRGEAGGRFSLSFTTVFAWNLNS